MKIKNQIGQNLKVISGNTNKFSLSGHWGGGQPGSVIMQRVTADELNCMKQAGKFTNGICHK